MEHWLVIDLEATTEEGGWPLEEMEFQGAQHRALVDARNTARLLPLVLAG